MESEFHAPDIECEGCAESIRRVVTRIGGVESVEVDVGAKNVRVTYEQPASPEAIAAALSAAGFTPV